MSCLARRIAVAHAALWGEPLPQTPPASSCSSRPLDLLAPWALVVGMKLYNATPEVVFRKLLRKIPREPKLLMLDVGAHVSGTFAFKGFWEGHHGIAFEPEPRSCQRLENSASRAKAKFGKLATRREFRPPTYGSIRTRCVVVGAAPGSAEFPNAPHSRSNRTDGFGVGKRVKGIGMVKVPVVRLDDEVSIGARTPNGIVLKSDTQGYEMEVMRGAERLFSQQAVRLLFVEMSSGTLKARGSSPLELMAWLHAHGYDCTHLTIAARRLPLRPVRFGYVRVPSTAPLAAQQTIPFQQMDELLAHVPPDYQSGSSDLMCWPANLRPESVHPA